MTFNITIIFSLPKKHWGRRNGPLNTHPGASKGTPGDAKCVTEIIGGGTKIRKLGTKFKFGQLILRKIIKIVVTRCHILRLKCTEFDFGRALPQTPLGELSTPHTPSYI